MGKIGCVVNYCTNDYRFLSPCLDGLKTISSDIVVSVCDHFFHGEVECRELLHRSYDQNQDVSFVEFAYGRPYGLYGQVEGEEGEAWARHWHNAGRYIGVAHLPEDVEYILFADVDEIADGSRFRDWLDSTALDDLMLFSSYVYLGDESWRSAKKEHAYLMVKKEVLLPEMLFNSHERPGFFQNFEGEKRAFVSGVDNLPLINHYNWVRSDEELRRKVSSWGHKEEANWHRLIDEGRLQEGSGHDYIKVEAAHDLLKVDVKALKNKTLFRDIPVTSYSHVYRTNPSQVMRKMLERDFS